MKLLTFGIAGLLFAFQMDAALAQSASAVICNPNSPTTNIRTGPTARNTQVVASLPNNTSVTIRERTKNPEGTHEWLRVEFVGPGGGSQSGFVFVDAVKATCGAAANTAAANAAAPSTRAPEASRWIPVGPNPPAINAGNQPPVRLTRQPKDGEQLWSLCPRQGGKCGYVDSSGKWVIEPQFDFRSDFIDGLARVVVAGKHGVIDAGGKWVVSPVFDESNPLNEGAIEIRINNKYGFIDRNQRWVVTPQLEQAGRFSEGLLASKLGGKWGYLDDKGSWIIPPRFDGLGSLDKGVAVAWLNNKAGLIDRTGNWIAQPRFDSIYGFSEGLAVAGHQSKFGFIDKSGRWVVEPDFERVSRFSEGLAWVRRHGKYGAIDASGKWIIEPRFDDESPFTNGLASVSTNGKWGVVNRTGAWIIEPRFDAMGSLRNGVAWARLAGKEGAIDATGRWLAEPKYDDVTVDGELLRVMFGPRSGFLDRTGKPLTFTTEDFVTGVMEGNQQKLEEKLRQQQAEIEKLRAAAAASSASENARSSDYQTGQGVFVCTTNGPCTAAIVATGGDRIKVEFTAFCNAGLITVFTEKQQEWIPRSSVVRSRSNCSR